MEFRFCTVASQIIVIIIVMIIHKSQQRGWVLSKSCAVLPSIAKLDTDGTLQAGNFRNFPRDYEKIGERR